MNKLKILTIVICCLVSALLLEAQCMEYTEKEKRQTSNRPIKSGEEEALGHLATLIQEAQKKAEKAKDKDLVVVLGNTGAGKSTVVNYVRRYKMIPGRVGVVPIAVPTAPDSNFAKIGNPHESETLFPSVYEDNDSKFVYCDCPGFEDNRGRYEKIMASIATEMTINYARSIRAIMVVVDTNDFITGKSKNIIKLGKTLGLLFKDYPQLLESTLFIFNKVADGIILSDIQKSIEDKVESEKKKLKSLTDRVQDVFTKFKKEDKKDERKLEDTANYLNVLNLMSSTQNIEIVKVFDDFESRGKILEALSLLHPPHKSIFHFDSYDNARMDFTDYLFKTTAQMTNILDTLIETTRLTENGEEQLEECEKQSAFYMAQLESSTSGLKTDNKEKIHSLAEQMESYKAQVERLVKQQASHKEIIEALRKEKEDLEADVLVPIWRKEVGKQEVGNGEVGNSAFSRFLDLYRQILLGKRKVWSYEGIPFTEVEKNKESGEFYNEEIKKDEGKYTVTYRAEPFEIGSASVEIRVKKALEPGNALRLSNIDSQLEKEEGAYEKFEKEILQAQSLLLNVGKLYEIYTRDEQNSQEQIENRKNELQRLWRTVEEEKKILKTRIEEAKKRNEEAQEKYESSNSFIETLYKVVTGGLDYPHPLINHFKVQYAQYLSLCEGKRDYAKEESEELLKSMECPITFEIMRDPVTTTCRHTFSRYALVAHLKQNPHCPICRNNLTDNDYHSNPAMQDLIEEYKKKKEESSSQKKKDIQYPVLDAESFSYKTFEEQKEHLENLQKNIENMKKELAFLEGGFIRLAEIHRKISPSSSHKNGDEKGKEKEKN